jgi:D-alanyl-D-alanine carboxypeptidase
MRILALPLVLVVFHGSIQPLPAPLRAELAAHLWHPGCPVALSRLRLLTVSYRGFDRRVHAGQLVVNAAVARPLLTVFRRLYQLRFPIRQMQPLDGSADDTSAFDCRGAAPSPCPGSTPSGHWSEHAYGEAVDINPIENPYTGCGRTRQRASIPYLNRSRLRPGMITPAVVAAFASIGWGWGGDWTGTKDYMHFSANGH